MRFDLSSIPAGSFIESATLDFAAWAYRGYPPQQSVAIFEATAPWEEETATWRDNCCAYGQRLWAVVVVSGGFVVRYQAELKELVARWVNGTLPNYGVVLTGREGGNENSMVGIYAKEWGTSGEAFLSVIYRPPPISMPTVTPTPMAVATPTLTSTPIPTPRPTSGKVHLPAIFKGAPSGGIVPGQGQSLHRTP